MAEARAAFAGAVARTPRDATAHYNLAVTCEALAHYDEALAHYEEVTALAPGFAVAHYNLAPLHWGRGEWAACFERFAAAAQAGYGDDAVEFAEECRRRM